MSDNDTTIELNRRRVLGGIATIGAASAALGAGTFAAFSDQEESQDNTIQAGSLDLDDISDTEVDINDLLPEESTDPVTISTTYTGTVDAPTLDWGIVTANDEVPDGSGSFSEVLDVTDATLEIDGTEVNDYSGDTLANTEGVETAVVDSSSSTTVTDGDNIELTLQFELQDVGNDYQEASIDFAVAFNARQDSAAALQTEDIDVNA